MCADPEKHVVEISVPHNIFHLLRGTVHIVTEYRECGCVTWKELGK